jgi:hypothetical protein
MKWLQIVKFIQPDFHFAQWTKRFFGRPNAWGNIDYLALMLTMFVAAISIDAGVADSALALITKPLA